MYGVVADGLVLCPVPVRIPIGRQLQVLQFRRRSYLVFLLKPIATRYKVTVYDQFSERHPYGCAVDPIHPDATGRLVLRLMNVA